MPEPPAP